MTSILTIVSTAYWDRGHTITIVDPLNNRDAIYEALTTGKHNTIADLDPSIAEPFAKWLSGGTTHYFIDQPFDTFEDWQDHLGITITFSPQPVTTATSTNRYHTVTALTYLPQHRMVTADPLQGWELELLHGSESPIFVQALLNFTPEA